MVSSLFVTPSGPHWDKITVVKDFVVSPPDLKGSKAVFYVEYIALGQIDRARATLRHSPLPRLKVRAGFNVILVDNDSQTGTPGNRSGDSKAASWRTGGSPPEPHLTIDAAILYITKMRDDSSEGKTKKNADRTLAWLKSVAS